MNYGCAYDYNSEAEIWLNATECCSSIMCHPQKGRDNGREGARPPMIILDVLSKCFDFHSQWILI